MEIRFKKDQLYRQLREAIREGTYPPGTKLPKEVEFAAQLGVAPVTLRSALKLLEEERLITRLRSRGTFVNEHPAPPAVPENLPARNRVLLLFPAVDEKEGLEYNIFNRNLALGISGQCSLAKLEMAVEYVSPAGLEQLSRRYERGEFAAVVWDRLAAPPEAAAIRALHAVLMTRLDLEDGLMAIYETLEQPLIGVLGRMEEAGVALDDFRLSQQSEALTVRIDGLVADAYKAAGHEFNLSSPKQLAQVLFTELGLPSSKKTGTGTPSTDEEVLTELALDYPLPKLILEHRRLTKLKSTFLDKLPRMVDPKDGRVHTTFGQAVAVTGRLASSYPNLQNIPVRTDEGRAVREAFVAESGNVIISADYSQIELRIMAHLSQDKGLLDAFARGEDIHRATAAEVFGRKPEEVTADERRMAKVINFGLIYGMSAFGLAQNLGIERRMAAHYIDEYFARYPGVRVYMDAKRAEAHERGYVETAFGRRLWIPEIASSRKPVQAAAERAAINAPMQGTAADLIKKAMIAVDAWLRAEGLRSRLVLQVHDELILEAPVEEAELVRRKVPELMAAVASLSVPLVAEVGMGDSWGAAH